MRLFEYQAKELFRSYGLPIPKSELAQSPEGAVQAWRRLGHPCALKAQVLAGGRGKAGGVVVVSEESEVVPVARRIFGLSIGGERPGSLLVEEAFPYVREMYMSVSLDRGARSYVAILSAAGGVEVESLQGKVVEQVPLDGFGPGEAARVCAKLGLDAGTTSQLTSILTTLERLSREKECELAEINPLAVGRDGKLMALDAKVILDDNALFRHPEFSRLHPEDELEGEASRQGFAFVRLDGNIAVVGNGAGLVLSTLDLVGDAGGRAACFLDLGGGAQKDRVEAALRLVDRLPSAERILVNIFGGITRTTDVADGIKTVIQSGVAKPVYARISGAEEDEARRILSQTPVKLFPTAAAAVEAVVSA